MMDAFFEPDGDGFVATELTRGPGIRTRSTPARRRR